MKHIFTYVFLLATTLTGFSQTAKKEIETDFDTYLSAIINQEFNKALDYTAEGIFELIPREQLLVVMQSAFNSEAMSFTFDNTNIKDINEPELINEKYYATLSYSNDMYISFINDSLEDAEDEDLQEKKELQQSLMLVSFYKNFGEENVTYLEDEDQYKIGVQKQVIAESPNGETNWKFIVIEKNMKPILEMFLPSEIIEKL
jgi:hypothetical protein